MRNRIWLLFFLIPVQYLRAQENLSQSGDCTVTVWIANPAGREITVEINPISLVTRAAVPDQRKMLLDNANKGVLNIRLKGPSIVKLMSVWLDSSASFIAMPGIDLAIHLDSARFNDTGPKETEFYNYLVTKSREQLKAIPQQDAVLYLKTWLQEHKAVQDLVAGSQASGMPTAYVSWIAQSTRSLFQSELCRQLVTYITLTGQWPSNMQEYVNNIDILTSQQFNQPAFFARETDRELVECYYLFFTLMQQWKKHLPVPGASATYRSAINHACKVRQEVTRNLMLRYLVTSATAHTTDTVFLNWLRNAIIPGSQDKHLVPMITAKRNLLRKLGKGQTAPGFTATAASGERFSYRPYKGKYLYIDVWATWCVPCKKEIPYLDRLKNKYAGQPIEFISVSTDKSVSEWKKFMASTESKDQFHSIPGNASSISEVYQVNLIPTFILVDPEGKIVNPDCYRPSNPALGFLIDNLLKAYSAPPVQ